MHLELSASLKLYNTFGLPGVARRLVKISSEADVREVINHPELGLEPYFILGGGSNVVLTRDVPATVLTVEIFGKRLLHEEADGWLIEAGAGENWHEFVMWTLAQGWPGLENMALIPGTVGASPVQNIGAYGLELKDHFESLDAIDLCTGRCVTIGPSVCNRSLSINY